MWLELPKKITKQPEEGEYSNIKIPNELIVNVDCLIGKYGYKSRGEIVKTALREFLVKYEKPEPRLERINSDSSGIKIFDRKIPRNRLVHVTFTPDGIQCDYHKSNTCEHVEFALEQADVQEIIKEKKKEGWNLPDC